VTCAAYSSPCDSRAITAAMSAGSPTRSAFSSEVAVQPGVSSSLKETRPPSRLSASFEAPAARLVRLEGGMVETQMGVALSPRFGLKSESGTLSATTEVVSSPSSSIGTPSVAGCGSCPWQPGQGCLPSLGPTNQGRLRRPGEADSVGRGRTCRFLPGATRPAEPSGNGLVTRVIRARSVGNARRLPTPVPTSKLASADNSASENAAGPRRGSVG
jgi:hypothetical protein